MGRNTFSLFSLLFGCLIFNFYVTATSETIKSIPVQISSGFDGNPMWVGVWTENQKERASDWSYEDTQSFSVEISSAFGGKRLIILKRDAVPVIQTLTPASISSGITVEFSDGATVSGTVVSVKDGSPVSEGLVSVRLDETLDIPMPEDTAVFVWDLEDGGALEVRGLPPGEHTVSVLAPGYMPAEQQVLVESTDLTHQLNFQLSKAEYIHGRIVDWMYKSVVEGSFDVVVAPSESQTTHVETEFDVEGNFRLGPFAENAVVSLVARTPNRLRSRPIEIAVPADDEKIEVYQWFRVLGAVQDQHTGDPIPQFSINTGRVLERVTEVSGVSGQFDVEICEDRHWIFVSILATGYSSWTSDAIHVEQAEAGVDLGVIELKPVSTVRGRVLDKNTHEPIEGISVFRDEPSLGTGARAIQVRGLFSTRSRTKTNAKGEFELEGFPAEGGTVWAGGKGYVGDYGSIEDVDTEIEIELIPASSISGQVISVSGEPIAAGIAFRGGRITTRDGYFTFSVPPGTHRYQAFAEDGASKVEEVTVEEGESVEGVRLVIEVVGRVYGTMSGLLDDETAQVWVEGFSNSLEYEVTDGTFELTGVAQGMHIVRSKTNLGRELDSSVQIDETMEGHVKLKFSGSSSLSGKLLADSLGLAGQNVSAIPIDSSLPEVHTRTVRDGSYRFEGLVNGNYLVEVTTHDFAQQVVVQGATQTDLHVHANRLSGKVEGSGSMEGGEVRLIGGLEGAKISLWTTVRTNGSYLFKGIPNGTYTLQISRSGYKELSQTVDVYDEHVKLDLQLEKTSQEIDD